MSYYPRAISSVVAQAVKEFRVVVLTGARQTGKTTLLRRLLSKTHQFVTLDDERALSLALKDPVAFFEQYPAPLIIDEIQYAPKLLRHIKMLVDVNNKPGQFVLTGSQRFTMIKGLQETLAGRVGIFELYPMSIEEGPISKRRYEQRLFLGGYPELLTTGKLSPHQWFASYFDVYVNKDVQSVYKLEKLSAFKDFLMLLAARASQVLNYQSFASDLGVSANIIKLWLKILEASGVVYLLRPYYINLGSRVVKTPKVYFMDMGLLRYLLGTDDKAFLLKGTQAGALFENFVVSEIVKSYANKGTEGRLFYYRTNNGLEVDLLIETKAGCVMPCEIKLTATPHDGMVASLNRLRLLNKKVSVLPGALICQTSNVYKISGLDTAYNLAAFLEHQKDLRDLRKRAHEPSVPYKKVLKKLKAGSRI